MDCGKLYFTLERKANPYDEDQLNELWGSIQINYEFATSSRSSILSEGVMNSKIQGNIFIFL